ncbi:MAG: serine/threonine-protein kinase [Planctomycetota bacterium]|nr:serine/threonine-protein kinase [Planctomycetota bacterium]
MSEELARRCLEESTRHGQSFLAVASNHRLLTEEQSRQIWAEYQRYQESAWSMQQSTAQGTRVVPAEARGQIRQDSGLSNSQLRSTSADKDGLPGIGDYVDGYEVIGLLGKGGMGAVFRVRKDSKDYALKVILTENDTALARFEREAQAAAAVDVHENIVRIFRYAQYQGRWYILSDFVKGCGLDEFLVEGEPLELERTLEIMSKVASAVDFIHQKGILHRDLKPANILIRGSDHEPLITDFGLARLADSNTLTKSQDFLGTPGYMAPEQAGSEHKLVGPASDIWALGVILYQLTTGQRPFIGESAVELITKILMGDPEKPTSLNPELPRDVETIIFKALQKEIPDRYSSAGDFARDCEAVLKGESIVATRMGRLAKVRRQLRRRFGRALPIVVALTVIVVSVVIGGAWYQKKQGEKAAKKTQQIARFDNLVNRKVVLFKKLHSLLSSDLLGNRQKKLFKDGEEESIDLLREVEAFEIAVGVEQFQASRETRQLKRRCQFLVLALSNKKVPKDRVRFKLNSAENFYLNARELWRDGNFQFAKEEFDKIIHLDKDLKLMAHFASGLASLKINKWKEGAYSFDEVAGDEALSEAGMEALRLHLERRALESLMSPKKDMELFERLVSILQGSPNSEGLWKQWNERLNSEFYRKARDSNWSTEEMVKRWRLLDSERKFEIGFRPPSLNKAMLAYLASRAKTKGEALTYYFKARQLNKHFSLPKGFRPSEIAGEIMSLLLVDSDRNSKEAFQFMMVASSSGIYVPVTRKIALTKFDKKGYFQRLFEENPENPLLYYWRGLIPPQYYQDNRNLKKNEIVVKLNRMNDDLTKAIESKELPSYYRAVALEQRVKTQQIIREYLDKAPAEPRTRWRADLERALVLQHPKPQLIYFQFWLWAEKEEEKVQWAQRRLEAIEDRRFRTENETLGKGRPWECPIEILDQGSYKKQAMDAYVKLAETYRDFQSMDKAVKAAKTGLSILPNSGYALTRYGEMLLLNKDEDEFERAFLDYKRRFGFNESLKSQFEHFLKTKKSDPKK